MELWHAYHYWLANHYLLLRHLRVKHRNIKMQKIFKQLIKHIVTYRLLATLRNSSLLSESLYHFNLFVRYKICYTEIVKFHLVAR